MSQRRVRLRVERLEDRRLMATQRFAVIGDFGYDSPSEAAVADLVRGFRPDAVITVGDNNYGVGAAETIDQNIGKHYSQFIGDYRGSYGPGSPTNRFFPSLGNHDWWYAGLESIAPYLDYFTLPGAGFENSSGNERYYDFVFGNVHFFALDSNLREPDGVSFGGRQGEWLRQQLAASESPFKIVYFHHAPYTSGTESGDTTYMQWPFALWGATAVLTGHEHVYERLEFDGIPYFISGVGGSSIYEFGDPPDPRSLARFNDDFGALMITASQTGIQFEFVSVGQPDEPVDVYLIGVVPEPSAGALVVGGSGVLIGAALWRRRTRQDEVH